MIAQLRGRVAAVEGNQVVLDVNGVGYLVTVTGPTLTRLPGPGQEAQVHTVTVVRDDAIHLYGFASREERRAFELLNQVTGVGPKLALAILTALDPVQFSAAVARGDAATLARVPGVGKKTAQRLILELKEKVSAAAGDEGGGPAPAGAGPPSGASHEAVAALLALGYSGAEAERAVAAALGALGVGAPVEEVIRQALKEAARR